MGFRDCGDRRAVRRDRPGGTGCRSSLEQALRTAQTAALCSPDFLFLLEPEGRLDDYGRGLRG